jgi:uncharacterized protein
MTETMKKKDFKYYLLNGVLSTLILGIGILFCIPEFVLVLPIGYFSQWLGQVLVPVLGARAAQMVMLYASAAIFCLVALLLMLIIKPFRPYLKNMGPKEHGNNWKMLLLGLLIGFVQNAFCVMVAILNGNLQVQFAQFEILKLLFFFVLVFLQSSYEEIVFRCFIFRRIRSTYNAGVAVAVSAIGFALVHIANDGISPVALLSITLVGVLYALMVQYCDSFWMPCAAHAAWNFTQNFLFGLPNSGNPTTYSLFQLSGGTTDSWAYNSVFGVECSWTACAMFVVCSVALILWGEKRKKKQAA